MAAAIATPAPAQDLSRRVTHALGGNEFLECLGGADIDEMPVEALFKLVKKGGSREQQLVEKLLLNALIEARSCERFKVLWKHIPDPELSAFYHELMISEAGHYKTFLQLAREFMPEEYVTNRWRKLLEEEANIMASIEVRGDRIH